MYIINLISMLFLRKSYTFQLTKITRSLFFSFSLIILYPLIGIAQKPDKIYWSDDYKLNWSDFKGKPKRSNPMAAETSTHLDFSMAYENNAFSWNLDCYFSRKESWVKSDLKSDDLLAHEQLHFDIAELNARKIRSEMDKLKLKSIDDNKKLQNVFEKGYERMSKQQTQYDKETDHGQLDDPQVRWIESIRAEMKKYEAFATGNYNKSE
jgi:hypothetical protein